MELNELFNAVNAIGRKYQDPTEIEANEQAIYEAEKELWADLESELEEESSQDFRSHWESELKKWIAQGA